MNFLAVADPLGLSQFSQHILGSIQTVAPYAFVGLFAIIALYGLAFRR